MIICDETGLTIIIKGNEDEMAMQLADKMLENHRFAHLILKAKMIIIEKDQAEIKRRAAEL